MQNYAIGCCQPVTHEYLFCPGGNTESTPSPACPGWQVLIDTVRALSPLTAIVPGPDGCLVNGESAGGTYPLYHASDLPESSYSCTQASRPFGGDAFLVPESDFSMLNPGESLRRPEPRARTTSYAPRARTQPPPRARARPVR